MKQQVRIILGLSDFYCRNLRCLFCSLWYLPQQQPLTTGKYIIDSKSPATAVAHPGVAAPAPATFLRTFVLGLYLHFRN